MVFSFKWTKSLRVQAKIRSRHAKAWAGLERISDNEAALTFDDPQEAITPGQGCVFYDGDRVLGGGWIASNSSLRSSVPSKAEAISTHEIASSPSRGSSQ